MKRSLPYTISHHPGNSFASGIYAPLTIFRYYNGLGPEARWLLNVMHSTSPHSHNVYVTIYRLFTDAGDGSGYQLTAECFRTTPYRDGPNIADIPSELRFVIGKLRRRGVRFSRIKQYITDHYLSVHRPPGGPLPPDSGFELPVVTNVDVYNRSSVRNVEVARAIGASYSTLEGETE